MVEGLAMVAMVAINCRNNSDSPTYQFWYIVPPTPILILKVRLPTGESFAKTIFLICDDFHLCTAYLLQNNVAVGF